MPLSGNSAASALTQLETVVTAFIDASSLIYTRKCGFLTLLGDNIKLVTIPEVVRETGYKDLPVTIFRAHPPAAGGQQGGALSGPGTDEQLLEAALHKHLPLISEDKKLLKQASGSGLPCFNAVMMLHLLYHRGVMKKTDYLQSLQHLRGVARYSSRVWAFSAEVGKLVEAKGQSAGLS